MIKSRLLKNVLSALAVVASAPVLLTLLFLFYALIFNLYDMVIPRRPDMGPMPLFFLRPLTLLMILAVIGWLIFRSKLAALYKAIYLTMPVAAVLAFTGIFFYERPVLVYALGALFTLGILAYLFFTRKSWLYYFDVILVSIGMLLVQLLGVEI